MVWVRLPVYFYKRNDTFYFSRSIPSDLQHRFQKRKIEVSLRTKSESKAAKSAAALSDRLERYWDSLRMEMIYSRELGLRVTPDAKTCSSAKSFSIREALEGCVVHSFRHSIRGRLRAVECPSDIVDAIGGWRTAGVGQGYGEGYSLEVLGRWLNKTQSVN